MSAKEWRVNYGAVITEHDTEDDANEAAEYDAENGTVVEHFEDGQWVVTRLFDDLEFE